MKAMKKVLAFVLALAMVVTAAPVTNAAAKTAKLSAGKTVNKSYYTGKTHTLKLTGVTKADAKSTTWKSSNAKVVKIVADSQTKVSAQFKCVKKGTATVTATVALKNGNTKTYKAKITIKAPTLTVSPSEMNLTVGQTQAITAKKTPSGAKLTYESSDPGVASVEGKKITAKSPGKATISVQLTNGTKKITKKIAVTVSATQDGLSVLSLSNPISADYPNTVWVNQNAVVNVQYVRDGKPVAGESLILTEKNTSYKVGGNATWAEDLVATKVAVTNANGIATFVIGFNDSTIKSTYTEYVGTFDYKVSTANGNASTDGQVAFAAIGFGKDQYWNNEYEGVFNVWVQNRIFSYQGRPGDLNDLAISSNLGDFSAWNRTLDGVTTTRATDTRRSKGSQIIPGNLVDYVDSQQVSQIGATNHQVAFDISAPHIVLPKSGTDVSQAVRYQQDVNINSGAYSVYTDDTKTIKLNVDPSFLTYATLNFSKIQLSEHTRLDINVYSSTKDANDNVNPIKSDSITGEADMLTNGYQIPLRDNYNELIIKLTLKSAGQVNTDKNAGYEVKDITGVYKTVTNGSTSSVPLKDAKITWETTTAPMSDVKTLNKAAAVALNASLGNYEKFTYQVPVFPYTGNAIITCYDKNNNAKAYYVCPTTNGSGDHRNENILGTSGCYEVSKDEAFNQVGTIVSQDNDRLVVNSEKVGVTSLKGTITIDGMEVPGLDATNDMLYTSVQWCPAPNVASTTDEYALVGQKVTVTAQLVDMNNNPVTIAGQDISFNCEDGKFVVGSYTAVSVDQKTDSLGQATLVLQSGEAKELKGVYATDTSGKYKVILNFKNGDKPEKATIKWFDADLKFTETVSAEPVKTDAANPYRSTKGLANVEPKAGSKWDYGFEVFVEGVHKTTGLEIRMSKGTADVGTVTFPTDKNGVASATSNKAGEMNITGTLDSDSKASDVAFQINPWDAPKKGVGEGAPALNKQLTLYVKWVENGIQAEFVTPNGTNILDTNAQNKFEVYVKVTDKLGNPIEGQKVRFKKTTDNDRTEFDGLNAANVTTTDSQGIAMATLQESTAGKLPKNLKTTVTAEFLNDNNEIDKSLTSIAMTYSWVQSAGDFAIDDRADSNGEYVTNYNNETGVITLTFKSNVLASSLKAGMVQAWYDRNLDGENDFGLDVNGKPVKADGTTQDDDVIKFIIKDVTVNGSVVSIKIGNKIGTVDADAFVKVTIKKDYQEKVTDKSGNEVTDKIKYTMTSTRGNYYADDISFFIGIDQKNGPISVEESDASEGASALILDALNDTQTGIATAAGKLTLDTVINEDKDELDLTKGLFDNIPAGVTPEVTVESSNPAVMTVALEPTRARTTSGSAVVTSNGQTVKGSAVTAGITLVTIKAKTTGTLNGVPVESDGGDEVVAEYIVTVDADGKFACMVKCAASPSQVEGSALGGDLFGHKAGIINRDSTDAFIPAPNEDMPIWAGEINVTSTNEAVISGSTVDKVTSWGATMPHLAITAGVDGNAVLTIELIPAAAWQGIRHTLTYNVTVSSGVATYTKLMISAS